MPQVNTNRMFLTMLDETLWGDEGGAGNEELVPILDGDYSVALEDPIREQQHILGDQSSAYMVQDVRNLRGSLKVGLWPHLWERLLNLAITRTLGEVDSVATILAYPGVEARVHAGLKVDSMTVDGSAGGDIMLTLELIGRHETTIAIPGYPGSYVIPNVPSLLFKNCRVLLSLDSDGAMENAFYADSVSQFSITVNNGHKVGPAIEDRAIPEEDGVAAFLTAGRVGGTFRATAAFDRAAYGTLQRSRLSAQMRVVGAHPSYTTSFTVVGAPVAGAAVIVTLNTDPTGTLAVNDYVFFDGAGGELPSVGRITAITPGTPSITIAVLDYDLDNGDNVYAAGFEIATGKALVSATTVQHPFDDFLTVEVSGSIFSGGPDPVSFKAKDLTLPA